MNGVYPFASLQWCVGYQAPHWVLIGAFVTYKRSSQMTILSGHDIISCSIILLDLAGIHCMFAYAHNFPKKTGIDGATSIKNVHLQRPPVSQKCIYHR